MAKLSRFCGTDLIGFRFLNEIPTRTIRLLKCYISYETD